MNKWMEDGLVAGEARGEGILMCPGRTVAEAERGMEQRLCQQR